MALLRVELWLRSEFHAMDRFVGCEVQVSGVRVKVELIRQTPETFFFGVAAAARAAPSFCASLMAVLLQVPVTM